MINDQLALQILKLNLKSNPKHPDISNSYSYMLYATTARSTETLSIRVCGKLTKCARDRWGAGSTLTWVVVIAIVQDQHRLGVMGGETKQRSQKTWLSWISSCIGGGYIEVERMLVIKKKSQRLRENPCSLHY
jgi:hypothetical protein